MYHNGDVTSLWNFLSDLLYSYDEEVLYSSDALSPVPNLGHFIMLDIECGLHVHDLSLTFSETLKKNFGKSCLTNLTSIIECPDMDPSIKARTLTIHC